MEHVGVVIQARVGGTRLPGKVLRHIWGQRVIDMVISRCQESGLPVYLAIPDTKENDALLSDDVPVARGPEHDVVERYRIAATQFDLATIIRVTADCPFIAPESIQWIAEQDGYALPDSNIFHGFEAQRIPAHLLESRPLSREHVMLYGAEYRRPPQSLRSPFAFKAHATVDTLADLVYLRSLRKWLPSNSPSLSELFAAINTLHAECAP